MVDGKVYVCDNPLSLKIKTLEGIMTAQPGDYIIKGVKGELYPCKPDIFKELYDEIPEVCRMSDYDAFTEEKVMDVFFENPNRVWDMGIPKGQVIEILKKHGVEF